MCKPSVSPPYLPISPPHISSTYLPISPLSPLPRWAPFLMAKPSLSPAPLRSVIRTKTTTPSRLVSRCLPKKGEGAAAFLKRAREQLLPYSCNPLSLSTSTSPLPLLPPPPTLPVTPPKKKQICIPHPPHSKLPPTSQDTEFVLLHKLSLDQLARCRCE